MKLFLTEVFLTEVFLTEVFLTEAFRIEAVVAKGTSHRVNIKTMSSVGDLRTALTGAVVADKTRIIVMMLSVIGTMMPQTNTPQSISRWAITEITKTAPRFMPRSTNRSMLLNRIALLNSRRLPLTLCLQRESRTRLTHPTLIIDTWKVELQGCSISSQMTSRYLSVVLKTVVKVKLTSPKSLAVEVAKDEGKRITRLIQEALSEVVEEARALLLDQSMPSTAIRLCQEKKTSNMAIVEKT